MFKKAIDATKNKDAKADSYVKTTIDGKRVIDLKKSHNDDKKYKDFKNNPRRDAGSSILDRLNKRGKDDNKGC